jgi:hypothetical protein
MKDQKDPIINKIRELEKIRPRLEWKNLTRAFLFSKIEESVDKSSCYSLDYSSGESFSQKENFSSEDSKSIERTDKSFFGFIGGFFPRVLPRAVCLILIFVMMSGGVFALGFESQESLPGDLFYPIKRTVEKAKIALYPSKNKVHLHTDLASRRLEELDKIAKKTESPQEKKEKAKEAIEDFKKEVETTKIALAQPKINSVSQKVEAVKKVREKTEEFKEILEKVPEQFPEEIQKEVKENIDEAVETSEEVGYAALEELAKAEDITDEETLNQIAVEIGKEIEKTESKINEVKEKVKGSGDSGELDEIETEKTGMEINNGVKYFGFLIIKAVQAAEDLIKEETEYNEDFYLKDSQGTVQTDSELGSGGNNSSGTGLEEEEIDENAADGSTDEISGEEEFLLETVTEIKEAEELLEKAKEYLAKKDFKTALKLISAARELVKKAERTIKDLSPYELELIKEKLEIDFINGEEAAGTNENNEGPAGGENIQPNESETGGSL